MSTTGASTDQRDRKIAAAASVTNRNVNHQAPQKAFYSEDSEGIEDSEAG